MAEIVFTHPLMQRDLLVSVKPEQITWAYGLNTAVYPTYGGEVVQILSVYFEDMTIAGTVRTVTEMEHIYGWFLTYMQYATQGRNSPSFDQQPVSFYYPERGWHFQIWPKSLPGFKYGRDVVAPTWKLTAAVKEPDATFADQIKSYAAFNAQHAKEFTFGKATADFGTTGDLTSNPWASPDGSAGKDILSVIQAEAQQLGDTFSNFVSKASAGDLSTLFPNASKPARNPSSATTKAKPQSGNADQRRANSTLGAGGTSAPAHGGTFS